MQTIENIIEWMNKCRVVMNLEPDIDESFLREHTTHDNWIECSCGGFTFKKVKKGIRIIPELSKILVSDSWRKSHPIKEREKYEIKENQQGGGLCPRCRNKKDSWGHTIYLSGGHCDNCGYTKPSDKIIIELWNQKKTLNEMIELLDCPNATYIKSRLRKYGLQERIGFIQEHHSDDNIHSVYAWENINDNKFPVLKL